MNMRELIDVVDEGVITNFVSRLKGKQSTGAAEPKVSALESPFNIIKPQDAKAILGNVLNGKPLEQWQIRLVQQVYNKL